MAALDGKITEQNRENEGVFSSNANAETSEILEIDIDYDLQDYTFLKGENAVLAIQDMKEFLQTLTGG